MFKPQLREAVLGTPRYPSGPVCASSTGKGAAGAGALCWGVVARRRGATAAAGGPGDGLWGGGGGLLCARAWHGRLPLGSMTGGVRGRLQPQRRVAGGPVLADPPLVSPTGVPHHHGRTGMHVWWVPWCRGLIPHRSDDAPRKTGP